MRSRGYRQFSAYKKEAEGNFAGFAARLSEDLHSAITADPDPAPAVEAFAKEAGQPALSLDGAKLDAVKSRLSDKGAVSDRVNRMLDSNFVKMTFPVMYGLYDAAAEHEGRGADLRRDVVEGHIVAIDLSEPMDRIVDMDEDLEYLDDYRLLCPYMLRLARGRIARAGPDVLESFERGFAQAREGQRIDEQLQSRPARMTAEDLDSSYRKYRSVMGTAGRNMALARQAAGRDILRGHGPLGRGCRVRQRDRRFLEVGPRQNTVVAAVLFAAVRRRREGLRAGPAEGRRVRALGPAGPGLAARRLCAPRIPGVPVPHHRPLQQVLARAPRARGAVEGDGLAAAR